MNNSGKALSTLLFQFALLLLLQGVNHLLNPLALSLHLDVLLVLFAGLYLRVLHGVWVALLAGLLVDAYSPLPPGLRALGILGLWVAVVWLRPRIHPSARRNVRLAAALLQAAWLILPALALGAGRMGNWTYWQRFACDLGLSLAVVWLAAPAWCDLQRRYLLALGWDLHAQARTV
jgi:cell shape-determining protein MreD